MSAPTVALPVQEPAPPVAPVVRPKRKSRLGGLLFGLLTFAGVVAVFLVAFQQTNKVSAKSDRPVAQAKKGDFLVMVTCRGELVAGRSVVVTAPTNVPDLRIVWMIAQGESVKPGTTILRFDDSSAKRLLQEKEAALGQAQASLDQAIAEATISEQKDQLDYATAEHAVEKAKLDVQRGEVVSALQAAEYKVDMGLSEEKLRVQGATARLNRASGQSKIASLQTLRDKALAEVTLTKERIGRMTVVAPSEGVVTYLMNFSQGWVNARPFKVGDNVWPGSSVAEIPDLSTLEMKAKVEEMDRSRISIGQTSRVVLDPYPEKPIPGSVVRVSPLTEQNFEWPPTRNFRAFSSLKEADKRLRPGMNGRAEVIVDKLPDAISVPAKAVFTRNGRAVVLTPNGQTGWKPIEVVVVARNTDEVAIKGINPGTTVALTDDLVKEKKP